MNVLIQVAADGLVILVFLMAMYAFLRLVPRRQWVYWGVRIFVVGVATYLLARLAGHFYQPETMRPFEKLGVAPGAAYLPNPGFPSDHALFAAFLTLAVWVSTRRRWYVTVMALATGIMCAGRVLALVHTVEDVIGGCLVALLAAGIYLLIPRNILQYSKRPERGEKTREQ